MRLTRRISHEIAVAVEDQHVESDVRSRDCGLGLALCGRGDRIAERESFALRNPESQRRRVGFGDRGDGLVARPDVAGEPGERSPVDGWSCVQRSMAGK